MSEEINYESRSWRPGFATAADAAEWWLRREVDTERAKARLREDLAAWREEHGVEAPGMPGLVEFKQWRAARCR